jgi:8-oxo-dGTP pyrophosphatase MutT (NUDIX family)
VSPSRIVSDDGRVLLAELLRTYRPRTETEAGDVARLSPLAELADPWARALPLHVTASALIVHPPSARVLLRWHARQQAWLQVGGHGDPGESAALQIALREAEEETGLADLTPWPDASLLHVAVVPVPARGDDPAHQHGDLRFVLATGTPAAARPEKPDAPLRWLSLAEARGATAEENLRETLDRLDQLIKQAGSAARSG